MSEDYKKEMGIDWAEWGNDNFERGLPSNALRAFCSILDKGETEFSPENPRFKKLRSEIAKVTDNDITMWINQSRLKHSENLGRFIDAIIKYRNKFREDLDLPPYESKVM
ncbi:hypothetical protein COT98_00095 [Candidatus Falkowbacteria bacterium CG10_big_fil_rev_8_21_14_0_10_39_9]|uniref:Uncharacterized protein n=1 Tax=Candidatus Falkowbacteria bacterium CG10_big_fil_rev_8_21_14_0_10_39_9 TaxID=1974566 RepID=A0A2M6WRL6_9BACT|nr:MAG: hypothetical protein COT98_00095 [Candidatus Falkowbacteria bacterium CG10_big_fil_rev_8_21_14_0_10_39_9]